MSKVLFVKRSTQRNINDSLFRIVFSSNYAISPRNYFIFGEVAADET